jgi:hypothetical protein
MTERPTTQPASGRARKPPRFAERSLLRNPLSVLAATLASFLVVLVLLTARVVTGNDPALRAGGTGTVLVAHRGHTLVRTTASGRVIGGVGANAGAQHGGAAPATLVTRTSGLLPGAGERDE